MEQRVTGTDGEHQRLWRQY